MIIIPDGKEILYEVINSRIIQITSTERIDPLTLNNEIKAISFGDYFIQIDDEFDTKVPTLKNRYIIKYIQCINKNNYVLITHLRNRTTSYILPSLEGNYQSFYTNSYLINAYLSENLNFLNLLYRFNTHISYKQMELSLVRHKRFISFSDENNSFVLFKFKIPDEFLKDIELFLDGKYSCFSRKLKTKIQAFNQFDNKQRIVQTIFKDKQLKHSWEEKLAVKLDDKMELDSIPNKDFEVWNNNLIK